LPSEAWQIVASINEGAFALRIAPGNVNSIRQRLPHLLAYLKEVQPDVLCLQEMQVP